MYKEKRNETMVRKRISFTVDSKVYDNYSKMCKEQGIVMSKKIELYMKEQLKKRRQK